MNKKRILAGIALTAGLGLTGVATAPVSGATTPHHASGRSAHAQPAKAAPGHKAGQPRIVCFVQIGGHAGKKGGKPTLPPLPGKPPKGAGPAGITTVKVVNGKVYINGKPAPKGTVKTDGDCPPPPPLPPKGHGGKGGPVIVQQGGGSVSAGGAPGAGAAEFGTSAAPVLG